MRITQNLGRSDTHATDLISGFVSTGSDWIESFVIPDGKITSADTFDWQLNFRKCREASSNDLSLSTSASTLTITQGSTTTTIGIDCPYSSLSSLCGDYYADLVYTDGSGNRVHQAHGIITFKREPVFS